MSRQICWHARIGQIVLLGGMGFATAGWAASNPPTIPGSWMQLPAESYTLPENISLARQTDEGSWKKPLRLSAGEQVLVDYTGLMAEMQNEGMGVYSGGNNSLGFLQIHQKHDDGESFGFGQPETSNQSTQTLSDGGQQTSIDAEYLSSQLNPKQNFGVKITYATTTYVDPQDSNCTTIIYTGSATVIPDNGSAPMALPGFTYSKGPTCFIERNNPVLTN